MPISVWPWILGAGAALAGGVFGLRWRERHKAQAHLPTRVELAGLTLALLAAAVGVAWRAWDARAWPGTSPADLLALLAGGGLAVAGWQTRRPPWNNHAPCTGPREQDGAFCGFQRMALDLTLIGGAALLGVAAALAATWPASSVALPVRTWLFGLRNILAGIGLGGWLPVLAASVYWYAQTLSRPTSASAPDGASDGAPENNGATAGTDTASAGAAASARSETAKPAEDPGRGAALLSFPWLTAACLVSAAWSMISGAGIDPTVAADLWLLAAWLLGGAYLTITSSWRPLRLPGWLSPFLAAGALAAGVLAASAPAGVAGSLR